uniref:Sugar phosphate phosphatase n=1 Tax=Phallusia mammillata TaxID=59560 RepID=A0A6F9D6A1_9ASCI|nr:UPF0364 protein C6orf211 homolog [Phallusia mammillata]
MMDLDLPVPLSASYKGTFAYGTVKDRIPKILTKLVDTCHKQVKNVEELHGKDGCVDALSVVGKLSQLRSEIMTDKPLTYLDDTLPDVHIWNQRFDAYVKDKGQLPTWFTAPWLYIECYMYRKIQGIIHKSKFMSNFDTFMDQKQRALEQSLDAVRSLTKFLHDCTGAGKLNDCNHVKSLFSDFIQISLWGNKCDLSISGGEENAQSTAGPHENLQALHKFVLVNGIDKMWKHLNTVQKNKQVHIDIILDNAGFELFTDLVLCEFLLKTKLVDSIRLHPKIMPWFVSDVTNSDFQWTLDRLESEPLDGVAEFIGSLRERINDKQIQLERSDAMTMFWSFPDAFCRMQKSSPQLYNYLSKSDLIIFKGDLNYRKLVGDLDWPHETPFATTLRGFTPAPLCALRTSKANVMVGLEPGQAERAESEDENWMVAGKYAVIQTWMP